MPAKLTERGKISELERQWFVTRIFKHWSFHGFLCGALMVEEVITFSHNNGACDANNGHHYKCRC